MVLHLTELSSRTILSTSSWLYTVYQEQPSEVPAMTLPIICSALRAHRILGRHVACCDRKDAQCLRLCRKKPTVKIACLRETLMPRLSEIQQTRRPPLNPGSPGLTLAQVTFRAISVCSFQSRDSDYVVRQVYTLHRMRRLKIARLTGPPARLPYGA